MGRGGASTGFKVGFVWGGDPAAQPSWLWGLEQQELVLKNACKSPLGLILAPTHQRHCLYVPLAMYDLIAYPHPTREHTHSHTPTGKPDGSPNSCNPTEPCTPPPLPQLRYLLGPRPRTTSLCPLRSLARRCCVAWAGLTVRVLGARGSWWSPSRL